MRLYPDIPGRRLATLAADAAVLVLVLVFAWLAVKVHDTVDRLAALGQGVHDAGSAVESGFESAADKVDEVPLVGGKVADGLRGAGEGSGGNVADLGTRGEDGAHRLANLLGLLTFFVPTGLLLLQTLPSRIAQVRRLTAAARVLQPAGADGDRRRLVAMRAAFSLPYGQLLEYTRDPLGDLAAERYDPLVAAALDDAGLRQPRRGG